MDQVRVAESRNSRTLLFASRGFFEWIVLFNTHLFLGKIARTITEGRVVNLHDLREGSALDLHEKTQTIPVKEVIFERPVRMEITEEEYALLILEVVYEFADRKN